MTLADTVKAMLAAGCGADQIAAVVEQLDEARRATARDGNRQRQANFRAAKRNANNAVTGRDRPLRAVTGRDERDASREASAPAFFIGEEEEVIPPSSLRSSAPKGAVDVKRGHRLPADWKPNADHAKRAVDLALSADQFADITFEFKNFWHAEAGAKARKINWDLTFTNRLIDQAARRRTQNGKSKSVGEAIREDIRRNGGDFVVPPHPKPVRPEDYFGEGKPALRLLSQG